MYIALHSLLVVISNHSNYRCPEPVPNYKFHPDGYITPSPPIVHISISTLERIRALTDDIQAAVDNNSEPESVSVVNQKIGE